MTVPDPCPYVGLRPFTAAERKYFFGRERDQRIIAANLFASPLTVLYGPSAVGKSSVLQAGVVPQLQTEPQTAIVYFATWQDPSYLGRLRSECMRAVNAAHGGTIAIDEQLPLDEWLARAAEQFRGTLLIILDQFEEYLLYHSEEGESSFDEELARITNRRDVPANVLLGIREDGLAKLDRFRKRIPNLLGNTLRLRRLSPEAAREAITGPIEVFNREAGGSAPSMQIEPALVDAVVDQVRASRIQISVSGGAGIVKADVVKAGEVKAGEDSDLIETALLQMVMTRLWTGARSTGSARIMEKAALDSLGGARNVVKLHLYERLGELPPEGQAIAADLFQQLVTPSGAKIAHTTDDLVFFAKQPPARVVPVLEHLAAARLLRRVDPPERYEIFHDALATAILDWRTEYMGEMARRTAVREAGQRRNRRLAFAGGALVIAGIIAFGWYERRELERQQLTGQVLAARAERGELLLAAATKEKDAAERSKEEAEATARKAELQVAMVTAGNAGQPGRAAQLEAQAKLEDAAIRRARQAAVESSQQAQANLDAALAAQKRIDALNQQLQQKGLSNPADTGTPAIIQTPPVLVELPNPQPSQANPVGAPPTPSAAVTPASTATAQGDYKAIYRQAINARDRKRWSDAAQLFQTAAGLKPDSGEIISMPGFGDDQPYLPFYNLGLARQNLKDCAGALQAWQRAEDAGAILKKKSDADALKKRRSECAAAK